MYVCIGVDSALFIGGIIYIIIANYFFKLHEKDRIRHIQITDLDSDPTQTVIIEPIIDGIGYPINANYIYKSPEYQPISQNASVVYKSTTEPNIGYKS